MCNEQHHDIPIRTLVTAEEGGWKAHCLDFDLVGRGDQPQEAVEQLEEEIVSHLRGVREGRHSLFRPVAPEVWRQYYEAAEAALSATGPGAAHIEHRPLVRGLLSVTVGS